MADYINAKRIYIGRIPRHGIMNADNQHAPEPFRSGRGDLFPPRDQTRARYAGRFDGGFDQGGQVRTSEIPSTHNIENYLAAIATVNKPPKNNRDYARSSGVAHRYELGDG